MTNGELRYLFTTSNTPHEALTKYLAGLDLSDERKLSEAAYELLNSVPLFTNPTLLQLLSLAKFVARMQGVDIDIPFPPFETKIA